MNREIDFLEKLAEAYQTYDASIVEKHLADDMHYASMWVFHEMTSKAEYMEYLNGKLKTLKNKNICFEFEVVKGGMHEHALLVTNQFGPNGEQLGFVADFNDKGQVVMINMTAAFLF